MNQTKTITLIVTATSVAQTKIFLDNIQATVNQHQQVEVIIKINGIDENEFRAFLVDTTYDFTIKPCFTNNRNDYQSCIDLADNNAYFFAFLRDIVDFITKGWDEIINSYRHYYHDDVFWLKLSPRKYQYYYGFQDCSLYPEVCPFITRTWLDLIGGFDSTSIPEAWQQCIDYHLGHMDGINEIPGIFRSVPINDIEVKIHDDPLEPAAFWQLNSSVSQQSLRQLSTQLYAYIWAKNEKWHDFVIEQNDNQATITLINCEGMKKVFYYHMSAAYILFENFLFLRKLYRTKSNLFLFNHFVDSQEGWRNQFKGIFKRMLLVLAKW